MKNWNNNSKRREFRKYATTPVPPMNTKPMESTRTRDTSVAIYALVSYTYENRDYYIFYR